VILKPLSFKDPDQLVWIWSTRKSVIVAYTCQVWPLWCCLSPGFALAGDTGWLGGELVDCLGVGVDDGANLDAPSSLVGRAALSKRSSAGRSRTASIS